MAPTAAAEDNTTKDLHTIGQPLGMKQHINTLKPSKLNPRKHFDEFEMTELQANIAKHGVILPIVGRQRKDYIEILDGERRWRAAMAAGVETVPVVLREMTDSDAIEFMLLNSIQRQDLTPLEWIADNKPKTEAAAPAKAAKKAKKR